MKKISILLPDLRPGGAERVCVNLANVFASRGLAIELAIMRNQGALLDALDPRIKLIDLRAPRPRNVLWPLIRYLRSSRPNVVLVNMWPLTVLTVLARSLSMVKCRVVAVEHTTWSVSRLAQRWRTRLMIKLTMRWFLPRADLIVTVSKGAARDLESFAGLSVGSVLAQYNPVTWGRVVKDPDFLPELNSWAIGAHGRILAVGTLKKVKDFPTLLKAFARIRNEKDVRLLLLGEGDERVRLEKLAVELGIQGSVFMPGFVSDTAPYYARADLVVLSSVSEGLPTVLIEALEYGIPVVSTDCPSGPAEILENGKFGRLVPVGNVDALAEAMKESLNASHDTAALMRRASDFSVEKVADQYLHLLSI